MFLIKKTISEIVGIDGKYIGYVSLYENDGIERFSTIILEPASYDSILKELDDFKDKYISTTSEGLQNLKDEAEKRLHKE